MNPNDAATLLQTGPTLAGVSGMSFCAATAFLQDQAIRRRVWACVRPLVATAYEHPGFFTAAYLCAVFPGDLFGVSGNAALVEHAVRFLYLLEDVAEICADGDTVDPDMAEQVRSAADAYYRGFDGWAREDASDVREAVRGMFWIE